MTLTVYECYGICCLLTKKLARLIQQKHYWQGLSAIIVLNVTNTEQI
jgi:hypothetical protein